MGEQGQQRGRRIVDAAAGRACGRAVGSTAVIWRCGRPSWRNAGVEVEHDVAAVADDEAAVAGERAEVGQLDAVAVAAGLQLGERSGGTATTIRSWASDSQISHGARPGYLSGDGGQLDVGADALGHLADGRRQPAGAAVGDRRPQVVGAGRARRSAASR